MRLRTAFMFLAVFAIIIASFQVEAGKKKKIKKIIMKALNHIPKKKILIPLPLPLPLPIPVIVKKQKIYIQESVPYAAPAYGGGGCGGDGYGCGGGGAVGGGGYGGGGGY